MAEDGLEIEDATVRFGATVAVDDVSLRVPQGGVTAVLGPSGCGKSTLLRAVAGLETLAEGTVRYAGNDLRGIPTHRRGFALMFQDGQLFGHLDVAGNVAYPLRRKGVATAETRAEVHELLALVGLEGYERRRPSSLSGGEQQRVALARALAAHPRLLLLDEPLSALDRELRERLAADLRHILVQTRTTALLVTHDPDEAFTVADDMVVMSAGRVVQSGTTAEVWRAPVDVPTARFLGFRTVLSGAAGRALLTAAAIIVPDDQGVGAVVARRSGFRLCTGGPLTGVVRGAAASTEGTRVEVDVEGLGPVAALADAGVLPAPGERVGLEVDPRGVAVIHG